MLHFTRLTLSHTQLFDTLRSEQPAVFDKVVPVAGDIMDPDMGLSKEDTQLLVENVAVVFHLAATIRFDAPLRYIYISKLQSFPPILPSLFLLFFFLSHSSPQKLVIEVCGTTQTT